MKFYERLQYELNSLKSNGNLRQLPHIHHQSSSVVINEVEMFNLSSNDYLGLACRDDFKKEFLATLSADNFQPTSSSSRLLTGNFSIYNKIEKQLTLLFDTESALVFNSGYHANIGILPAICSNKSLILADKLVHASLIDGIRLSSAKCIRYKHNDYDQLERLVHQNQADYTEIIIVTESIFSMDGDECDLKRLIEVKALYPNILLYIDEAHAFGVRGNKGLGLAEEFHCINDIDFLVGTFGKALASTGAYIVCKQIVRDYLINKMRSLIFTTALPPITLSWTSFLLEKLPTLSYERDRLQIISYLLQEALKEKEYKCASTSHIIPMIIGESCLAIQVAETLQRKGFYALPVRPPTVSEGTSRIRFSLSANLDPSLIEQLINIIPTFDDIKQFH